MKKITFYLIILIGLFSPIFVSAQEYKTMQLIPVDSVATVKTDKFNYQDFLYNSKLDDKGNAMITFNSIVNNTVSKTPISINILLFGEDQKNIGIVTYCTNKDYGNTYEGFKLNSNQAVPFSIKVTPKKYFVENKAPGDVKYIAVMDENKYCKIGGYSNYEGLTIDEIANGISSYTKNRSNLSKYVEEFLESGSTGIIILLLIILGGYIIYGMILNALYKKMYGRPTVLAYLPITNIYITIKLAFGKMVALIVMGIYLLSGVLVLLGLGIVVYLAIFLDSISFIVVIIKLITRKYDLFSFDPDITSSVVSNKKQKVEEIEKPKENVIDDSQKALDLSYDNVDDVSISSIDDNTFDVSSGEAIEVEENTENSLIEDNSSTNDSNADNSSTEEEKKEESDLSKFFE